MKTIIGWIVLFLMAIWLFISWHWYTCKIKGFCDKNKIEQSQVNSPLKGKVKPTVIKINSQIFDLEKECSGDLTEKINELYCSQN